MEHIQCKISAVDYDKAVHGGLDDLPVLSEGGDLSVFVKPKATVGGNTGAVLTFTVRQVDGSMARVQCVVTAALLVQVGLIIKGWKEGGHI